VFVVQRIALSMHAAHDFLVDEADKHHSLYLTKQADATKRQSLRG
jgi:hypothetical protein